MHGHTETIIMLVDNPAFYDSESGLCTKEDAYQKKQSTWSEEGSCSKRQCNGRLLILMVSVCLLLAVLMAMVTAVIYLAVGEVRTTWQDDAEFQEAEEGE
ncbi:vitellogenin receptor [Trichonephila clavipes]|nr:vitellogenin receptor [Trichonephila clavipes]